MGTAILTSMEHIGVSVSNFGLNSKGLWRVFRPAALAASHPLTANIDKIIDFCYAV